MLRVVVAIAISILLYLEAARADQVIGVAYDFGPERFANYGRVLKMDSQEFTFQQNCYGKIFEIRWDKQMGFKRDQRCGLDRTASVAYGYAPCDKYQLGWGIGFGDGNYLFGQNVNIDGNAIEITLADRQVVVSGDTKLLKELRFGQICMDGVTQIWPASFKARNY